MIKSIRIIVAVVYIGICFPLNAQFSDTIRVVFEKKMNIHKVLEKFGNDWMMERIKHFDKFQVENYEFIGTSEKSLYKYKPKTEDEEPKRSALWGYSGTENIVFNNYNSKICTLYKTVYEDKMLIQDTLKKLNWRITNESRPIAGYSCRKAVATIYDSVLVYAFYAQELMCPGGPETFNGLPGMILGVAVPIMHTTWFAISVDTSKINVTALKPPTKGKKHNYKSIYAKLSEALKDWEKMRDLYLWMNGI